ncbi:hypothetical protein GALMADRAFT_227613 [Galerina marginata CBS 339.88]|uniref:Uncharacterized protein n=1 Tax=Galerina marginata (strain CBS 339.88) TaxID=685588 RepID=A0A067SUV5_GALM3|nr:hypothetical protein GALMADRAFT_227613 [Galerina marginata CBS 339.88]
MSRTGLLSFVFFCLSISLVASAPLPELGSNLVERSYDYESDGFFERSPALFDRDLHTEDEYFARDEFDNFDLESRGFFKNLGHDLAKAGKGLAKVDLRVASAASGAVSKATRFIPGVGKGVGLAAKAESRLTNAGANAIHRRGLFSKLKKAAKGLVKFDLKAMSTVSGGVAKVGRFIPGVGKAAATFSKVESKVTGAAANAIH